MTKATATASATSSGLSFTSLLTCIFVAAKLFGVVNWSWWLVFSPVLISAGLLIALVVALLLIAVVTRR